MSVETILIEGLYKQYTLGTISYGLLYKDIQRWWALSRGKEDPNSIVSQWDNNKQDLNERFWALNDVNLSVKEGEILGIVGRNGAGKSTLLKILSRVTAPTRGTVKVRGRISSLLEVGTGFHPELTGRENVYLNGAILGMNKKEITRKFDDIVNFSEIEKFIDTPIKRYSSGMYVRLAFAVAAFLDSDILLVDEVLAVGDVRFQKKCLGKIGEIGKSGRTILFISHNISAIRRLCDKGILLEEGRIVFKGNIDKVIAKYLNQEQESVYTQPLNCHKDISLTRVEVVNSESKVISHIPYNESFFIRIYYKVNKPVSNCNVAVLLESADLVRVFDTCDYDSDPALLGQRDRGSYRATLEIPGNMLNIGSYRVFVGISSYITGVVYEYTDTVSFEILEIGHLDAIAGVNNNRKGILQPLLNWKTEIIH
jgi:lipopolysaccharide transport system ATP-binding protein